MRSLPISTRFSSLRACCRDLAVARAIPRVLTGARARAVRTTTSPHVAPVTARCAAVVTRARAISGTSRSLSSTTRGANSSSNGSTGSVSSTAGSSTDEADAQLTIQEALRAGELGMGFSAGGFLYCYHLGFLWELEKLGVLEGPGSIKMAGASAGSLAIVTYNSGISKEAATEAYLELANDCRVQGTPFRLSGALRSTLERFLPRDAHMRCSGVCHVAVTQVWPRVRSETVAKFDSKAHLTEALLASCHVPVYASGTVATQFGESIYLDGGLTQFIPSPPTKNVVKVSCYPVHRALATTRPAFSRSRRLSKILNVDVSPDAFEPLEHSYARWLRWAVLPGEDHVLEWLVEKGRRDASAWAKLQGLTLQETRRPAQAA